MNKNDKQENNNNPNDYQFYRKIPSSNNFSSMNVHKSSKISNVSNISKKFSLK